MAEPPATIRVTHDELATKIIRTGQNLIELGMALREGFDVPVSYERPSVSVDVSEPEEEYVDEATERWLRDRASSSAGLED